jgi:hypothetical protein
MPAGLSDVVTAPAGYGFATLFLASGVLEFTLLEQRGNEEPGNFGGPADLGDYSIDSCSRELDNVQGAGCCHGAATDGNLRRQQSPRMRLDLETSPGAGCSGDRGATLTTPPSPEYYGVDVDGIAGRREVDLFDAFLDEMALLLAMASPLVPDEVTGPGERGRGGTSWPGASAAVGPAEGQSVASPPRVRPRPAAIEVDEDTGTLAFLGLEDRAQKAG